MLELNTVLHYLAFLAASFGTALCFCLYVGKDFKTPDYNTALPKEEILKHLDALDDTLE